MTRLPADVTRCTGNSGDPNDNFRPCPVREDCARYKDYFAPHVPANVPVPRMYAPKICDLYIPYTHEQSDKSV